MALEEVFGMLRLRLGLDLGSELGLGSWFGQLGDGRAMALGEMLGMSIR
jgi:hypothetical protein